VYIEDVCHISATVATYAVITIMQENQPIAYASRALTNTETRYAQIEKELLSVIFGLERFHQYTYGRTVQVRSDHKSLESQC
jgi:hypothetical protein